MQKKQITGYDETKKMLNTLRKLNENKTSNSVIKEQQEVPQQVEPEQTQKQDSDFVIINDVEVKMLSTDEMDMELKDDQKETISNLIDNFRQQVSQIVDFDPGMTINQKQIRLDGVLTDEDISFVLIAGEESGVYINADMLKLETEVGNALEKLVKFQETFKTSMEPLITQRNNN
jgi:hypothetical protein